MQVPIWGVQHQWAAMGLVQCCAYLASLLLILLSSLVLVVLIVHFLPHMRTVLYAEGTCAVVKSLYTVQYSCGGCHHGDCHAFYPCLLLYVLVNTTTAGLDLVTREQLRWPVPVFENDWQQIHVFRSEDGSTERCTKYACEGATRTNRDVIERYRLRMSDTARRHRCWFDPDDLLRKGAIFRREISWTFTFHVVFWPTLFLLVGLCLLLVLCCRRRRRVGECTARWCGAKGGKGSDGADWSSTDTGVVRLEKY